MAKFWLCLASAAFCCIGVAACEDNPDQFYKKAPAGAGDRWNNGNTPPVYDNGAKNGFTDQFNTSSKDEACSGSVKHQRWAELVTKDIIPPKLFGGLDLRGGENWTGLKFTDAQKINCQATPVQTEDDKLDAQWGDAGEVFVHYYIATNIINQVELRQGYTGKMNFKSRPDDDSQKRFGHPNPFGQHSYTWGVGDVVRRDGNPWLLNWTDFPKQATEMFDALMATFAPDLDGNQDDCTVAQTCLASATNGEAYFGARPLGVYLHIPNTAAPQPTPSTPDEIYAYYVKLLPFSPSPMFLKLDKEGPIATSAGIGDKTPKAICSQRLGMTYSDLLANCVNVYQDAAMNDKMVTKLLGGMSHTKEVFDFSVQGIDTDMASSIIGDDKIVGDDWTPSPTDTVYHFNMDVRASGTLLNEQSEDGATFTFGGTGAIYREYARRTQAAIHDMMKTWRPDLPQYEIGDPHCVMSPGDNPATWKAAPGCTGFEQLITPGERVRPAGAPDDGTTLGERRLSLGARANKGPFGMKSALKPGDPLAIFCVDPPPNATGKGKGETCTADSECWSDSCSGADGAKKCDDVTTKYYQHCGAQAGDAGMKGPIYQTSFTRVKEYLGQGDILKLPPALRDPKYYFQQFGFSIVKYLMAAGNSPRPTNLNSLGPTDCSGQSCEPSLDHLQFDQIGASADNAKLSYIDRRFVGLGQEPISYEYQTLIVSANQQESRFRRMLERDEKAVFSALQEDKSKPLASPEDNVRLSNIIGSKVIAGGPWSGVSAQKDAYFCATHDDTDCKAGGGANNVMPKIRATGQPDLDDDGQPVLTNYKGAFGETAFSLGTSHLKMVQEEPLLKSARVAVPIWDDPYSGGKSSSTTAAGPQVKVTLPDFRPLAPGSGFRIPVNAQRDRFIPAAQVDFSGQNISLAINYKKNDDDQSMQILGVETQTFEGELFLCQDPGTNDLLHVRQYDSVAEVQDWLAHHPGASSSTGCDILVRFSPFNEAPVSITSKSAGVQVNVGQGVGIGRIIDALIYDVTL
jgi:hypothetical protein